jgi:hypothetical protein
MSQRSWVRTPPRASILLLTAMSTFWFATKRISQREARTLNLQKESLRERLELSTYRLTAGRAANCAIQETVMLTDCNLKLDPIGTSNHFAKHQKESIAGFEPAVSCSVGRRLIHWAIQTTVVLKAAAVGSSLQGEGFSQKERA